MEGLASLHIVVSPVYGVVVLYQYGRTCIITHCCLTCLRGCGPLSIWKDLHHYTLLSHLSTGLWSFINMEGLASLHIVVSPVYGVVVLYQYGRTCIITHCCLTCLRGCGPLSIWKDLHHYTLLSHLSTGLWSFINMEGLASLHIVVSPVYGVVVLYQYGRTCIITHCCLTCLRGCGPLSIWKDLHHYTLLSYLSTVLRSLINNEVLASSHMIFSPVYWVVVLAQYGKINILAHDSLTCLLGIGP